jgi:phage shock protein E
LLQFSYYRGWYAVINAEKVGQRNLPVLEGDPSCPVVLGAEIRYNGGWGGAEMRRVGTLLVVWIAVFLLAGCAVSEPEPQAPELKLITGEEARAAQQRGEDVIFVDVRSIYEHEEMRIPGSILIPLEERDELLPRLLPDKDAFIVVYCDVGGQSGRLAEIMTEMGYTRVYQLGKLRNWEYEVERGPAQ